MTCHMDDRNALPAIGASLMLVVETRKERGFTINPSKCPYPDLGIVTVIFAPTIDLVVLL